LNVVFVTGTAGAGKSLLTASLLSWYHEKSQNAIAVNLDPGVVALPYEPDVDVRTMIDFQEIMQKYSLGRTALSSSPATSSPASSRSCRTTSTLPTRTSSSSTRQAR